MHANAVGGAPWTNLANSLPVPQIETPAPLHTEDRIDTTTFVNKMTLRGRRPKFSHPQQLRTRADVATRNQSLDLDDIAPAGSSQQGSIGLSIGPFPTVALGVVGVGIAFGLGTWPAINQVISSTRTLRDLRKQDAQLHTMISQAQLGNAVVYNHAIRNGQTALRVNRVNHHLEHWKRAFAGLVAAPCMTMIGAAIVAGPNLVGSYSAAAAAASVPMLTAGTLGVPVFAAGMVGYEVYRFITNEHHRRHAHRLTDRVFVGNEPLAEELLRARLRRIRWHSVGTAACFVGIGVGAPLSTFVGPVGLSLLLPGIFGIIYAGYYNQKKIHYDSQYDPEQRMRLGNVHETINHITQAYEEYLLLKQLKAEKRLWYPFAEQTPPPVSFVVRGVAAYRRWHGQKHVGYEPCMDTIYRFLQGQNALEQTFYRRQAMVAADSLAQVDPTTDPEAAQLLTAQYDHVQDMLRDTQIDGQELLPAVHTLHPSAQLFLILRFLVRRALFPELVKRVWRDRALRNFFVQHGISQQEGRAITVDANALVLATLEHVASEDASVPAQDRAWLLERIAQLTERILFTVEKDRCQYRQRELLDILAERVSSRHDQAVN